MKSSTRWIVVGLGWCAWMLGAVAAAQGMPVAMLTDMQGHVEFATEPAGRTLKLAAPLHIDDALELAAEARLVVAYSGSGAVYEVRGPGIVRIGKADLAALKGASVLRSELPPQLRGLVQPGRAAQASIVLRAAPRELMPLAPRGAQLWSHARTLRWVPMDGAEDSAAWEYFVKLIDETGAIVHAARTQMTAVTLPADLAMRRGERYLWTIEARGPNGRRAQSESEFTLVGADVEQALLAAQPAAKGEAARAVYLIALRQHGLLQAAEAFSRGGAQ
jgi:hypothetical protein